MNDIVEIYDSKLISRKNNGWYIRNKNSISLQRIEAVEAKLAPHLKITSIKNTTYL